ncbi:50S ribosomal protein L3 [Candidatus Parcubacteria bacterium]|nr:50S ribosomal protein L3 [Candidatus Parcubacteria bacterium]
MPFLIGRKIEMAQQFKDDGTVVAVTLVKAEPNIVTQVRTKEKDGYGAVQLGAENVGALNKSEQGHLKDLPLVKTLREFRITDGAEYTRGQEVRVDAFTPGMRIDVVGFSKGRGFAGVVKRHHFEGAKATHGNKDQIRMPGSIGSQRQGKVIKGQRMGGHMGDERVTVKNLEVVSVDPATNVMAIKGAIPGARGGLVLIRSTSTTTIWHA